VLIAVSVAQLVHVLNWSLRGVEISCYQKNRRWFFAPHFSDPILQLSQQAFLALVLRQVHVERVELKLLVYDLHEYEFKTFS
jgi:hypothetical protein